MVLTKNFIKKYKIPIQFGANLLESSRWAVHNTTAFKNKKVLFVTQLFSEQKNQLHISSMFSGKHSFFKQLLQTNKQLRVYFGFVKSTVFSKFKQITHCAKGQQNTNILILLECRLQTIIYRLNFSKTIIEARQLIAHGHICINNKNITSSDYIVNIGDVISVKQHKKSINRVLYALHACGTIFDEYQKTKNENINGSWHQKKCFTYPEHLEVNYKKFSAVVTMLPNIFGMKYPTVFF